MKKGISHLDWAISMGIFLVALISIFVYLKPFSGNFYSGDDLASIVKEEFQKEAYWTVKKLPLFVEDCIPLNPGEEFSVDIAFENGWKDVENKPSITVRKAGVNTIYLHNLDSNKKFGFDLNVNPAHCSDKVSFGVIEDIVGISDELVKLLAEKKYDSLMIRWKFPPGRDFAIFIDDIKIKGGEPHQRANVYADQSKEFIVSGDGSTREVVISFRAW